MLDFTRFRVLTFDCYGTMIDWETGIWNALRPIIDARRVSADRERVLQLFGELESEVEHGPYQKYRAVLAAVCERLGAALGFTPRHAECEGFAASVGDWPPFPDSGDALRRLQQKYRLGVISNVDDDLFAHSARALGVTFDYLITAQQVGSYKPSLNNFRAAFTKIGVPQAEILHVAQSVFHDIVPAKSLGLATVWVNRRAGQAGAGATPPASATPDIEVHSLKELADLV